MKELLKQSAANVSWRDGYGIPARARDLAESALREFREGDVDPNGFRDTSDEIKEIVAKQLHPERILWGSK